MIALLLVVVPPAASLALGRVGPRAAQWLAPSTSVRLLTGAAVATALATGFVLSTTAFTAAARVPAVAALGHWSASTLTAHDYVPFAAGAAATAVVVALLTLALWYVITAAADLVTADATCRRLGPGTDRLVIVDDDRPDAYVVPGIRGRIVVSTAMLRALPADERRALMAHEHAHLRHRHHLYIQLAELGARANPLLHPLVEVVRVGVERWADEDAATATGDRRLMARAIARAALAQRGVSVRGRVHQLALGVATTPTVQRPQALLNKPQSRCAAPTLALTALVAAGPLSAFASAVITEHYFELAQAALITPR